MVTSSPPFLTFAALSGAVSLFDLPYSIQARLKAQQVCYTILHRYDCRGDIFALAEAAVFISIWAGARIFDFHTLDTPLVTAVSFLCVHHSVIIAATLTYRLSPWHPLADIPGPLLYKTSSLCYARLVMSGWRHKAVQSMHEEYGDLVRLGTTTELCRIHV